MYRKGRQFGLFNCWPLIQTEATSKGLKAKNIVKVKVTKTENDQRLALIVKVSKFKGLGSTKFEVNSVRHAFESMFNIMYIPVRMEDYNARYAGGINHGIVNDIRDQLKVIIIIMSIPKEIIMIHCTLTKMKTL